LRVAFKYTHTMHLHRDTELGRGVTWCVKADMKRVKTRALETLPVSSSVVKVP
jgi:hypothetical protein